jgi:uncharacterized protein YndB with AHSA1/START domain
VTSIVGSLRIVDGKGVVRVEDRFDTAVDDLWSALTDPVRLGRWLGEFDGDLRLGGEFKARFFASGWEGSGRVEVCDAPRHLVVSTTGASESEQHIIEATLTADGAGTVLVVEERGMPVGLLAAYGGGVQIHVEDLAAYLSGQGRCDAEARWKELQPAYVAIASGLDQVPDFRTTRVATRTPARPSAVVKAKTVG